MRTILTDVIRFILKFLLQFAYGLQSMSLVSPVHQLFSEMILTFWVLICYLSLFLLIKRI